MNHNKTGKKIIYRPNFCSLLEQMKEKRENLELCNKGNYCNNCWQSFANHRLQTRGLSHVECKAIYFLQQVGICSQAWQAKICSISTKTFKIMHVFLMSHSAICKFQSTVNKERWKGKCHFVPWEHIMSHRIKKMLPLVRFQSQHCIIIHNTHNAWLEWSSCSGLVVMVLDKENSYDRREGKCHLLSPANTSWVTG